MKRGWLKCATLLLAAAVVAKTPDNHSVFEQSSPPVPETALDLLLSKPHSRHNLRPKYCSDAVFVRRVYLDTIGTLPTADETRAFLTNTSLDKRRQLVAQLLEREEFADYWAMKWSDLLRIKAEFPVNLWPNAAQAYHRWLRASLRDNKSYATFTRELLTANGSNFREGAVNFYRAIQDRSPQGIATAVALTFMGCRAEQWPTNQLYEMSHFFAQISYKPSREWKEEIVFWDPLKNLDSAANPTPPTTPRHASLPDGTRVTLTTTRDPRDLFCEWLITPKNNWFTANIVNRVWSWLMGRGIIHEPDDLRADNPPSNPALLNYLRREFVRGNYDLKHLFKLILTSRAYNYSSFAPGPDPSLAADLFALYPMRQLEAEVLIDAINKVTGASDLYTSAIPEPFTFIPENKPAISLPDGSITSPFLELFGRPARATGLENERVNTPSAAQRMHLLNSSHIQQKLESGSRARCLFDSNRPPAETLAELYLTFLARYPTTFEISTAYAYLQSDNVKRAEAWRDLAWAVINSDEFIFRH